MEEIKKWIRDIPDFPKPGIIFKDITPLLSETAAFQKVIDAFAKRASGKSIDYVIGIESRGFIFGGALAYRIDAGFIPIRKKGKLPYKTDEVEYDLEYGTGTLQIHQDAIHKGSRVLIVDDLLATGGTAKATCNLIEKSGGVVVEVDFVVELAFLNGRDKLKGYEICSLVQY